MEKINWIGLNMHALHIDEVLNEILLEHGKYYIVRIKLKAGIEINFIFSIFQFNLIKKIDTF